MEFITSPWEKHFLNFARSIDHSALLVSPYITSKALSQLTINAKRSSSIRFKILTKLDSNSMSNGSLDVEAIAKFCREFPNSKVSHLPGLHAKVYIADSHTAIVTSGNLTFSSLSQNFEYGVLVKSQKQISEISQNIFDYEKFGTELSYQHLKQFGEIARRLTKIYDLTFKSSQVELIQKLKQELRCAQDSINELRGISGQSITSIFSDAVSPCIAKWSVTNFYNLLSYQEFASRPM